MHFKIHKEFSFCHIKNKPKSTSYENVKLKGSFGIRSEIDLRKKVHIHSLYNNFGARAQSPLPFFPY